MIRVSSPQFLGNEKRYVNDCLDKVELSMGEYVDRFEKEFAKFCGVNFAIATCNGTAALHLALKAIGVRQGDHVVVPALSYVAVANAVTYCGATPIFCEVESDTWTMSVKDVAKLLKLDAKITTIVPVHLYGVPADMGSLTSIAREFNVAVVENAAEAHGAKSNGIRVGSLGDIGVFSFYGNKLLTCGEGGMVTTDDPGIDTTVRMLRGQGVQGENRYYHSVIGYNYRMTNIQGAIGLAQLEDFERHNAVHQRCLYVYRDELKEFEQQDYRSYQHPAPWMYTVLVPQGISRNDVMKKFLVADIETRPAFVPLTQLPMYAQATPFNAAQIGARGVSLPTHGGVTNEDLHQIAALFKSLVQS